MSLPFRRPTGLLLAGGGSLGSWQSGFLSRLVSRYGAEFDAALGISTGALTAAAYALDRLDLLCARWREVSGSRILRFKPRLVPPTLFGNESLWEVVADGGSDEEAKARARVPFTVIVTERATGTRRCAKFTPRGEGGWDAPLGGHLVASCSIPDIFPPVRLPDAAGPEYEDGGNGTGAPDFSALAGCADIVVVEMIRPEEPRFRFGANPVRWREQPVRFGQRRYIEAGLEGLRQAAGGLPPRLFRAVPREVLDFSLINFSTSVCAPALRLGEEAADAFAAEPLLTIEAAASQEEQEMLFSRRLSAENGEPNG